MSREYGWAIINANDEVMLPVFKTRVETIRFVVHAFNSQLGERGYGSGLLPRENREWRQYQRRYGMRCRPVIVTAGATP